MGTHPIFESDFDCLTEKMVATKKQGKARKSTHQKKQRTTKAGTKNAVVEIDPKKKYEVAEVGPLYLSWGKKKVKNSKGKFVKQFYLKKKSKHLVWVKWTDPFQDESEKDDEFCTEWSAEEQSMLEGGDLKKQVAKVIKDKVVWPWITENDEEATKRKEILKQEGFKEWKSKSGKGRPANWQLKNSEIVNTESETESSE